MPVATDLPTSVVLAISEHREDFPGVAVETQTLPHYPDGSLAAHVLGYTGQITAADKKADPRLCDADTIGVSGLEEQYDSWLRGVDGAQTKQLNPQGYSVGDGGTAGPGAGRHAGHEHRRQAAAAGRAVARPTDQRFPQGRQGRPRPAPSS